MKSLFSLLLCFSLMIFIGHSVNAIEDHSPPGIEMQCDMVSSVSIDIDNSISFESPGIQVSVPITKQNINRGILCDLRFWPDAEKCIINDKITRSDNSLYAYNCLLYEAKVLNDYEQKNKHGDSGLETFYNQSFLQS